jgi:hypothetical protein
LLAEISAGLSSLKAAFDITKGLSSANTQVSINEVKIELQQHIIEAQQALSAANEAQSTAARRIAELELEVAQLKDWSSEKKRYELYDAGRGAFVYMPRKGLCDNETPHWLCPNCFNRGRKSFLQFKGQDKRVGGGNGDESTYACDDCKASLKVRYNINPKVLWGQQPTT